MPQSQSGAIVLLHDIHSPTVLATELAIERLVESTEAISAFRQPFEKSAKILLGEIRHAVNAVIHRCLPWPLFRIGSIESDDS